MLPWEHAAFAYVLYSVWVHARRAERPGGLPVLVVGVASVLPDLVDKPLGWWLGMLPSIGLGHSVFFAVPLVLLAWAFAGGRYALPLGVGLGTHLAGDVFFKAVAGGTLEYEFMFWPLIDKPASEGGNFLAQFQYWMAHYVEFVTSPEGMAYLGFELVLLGTALVLWVYDGFPGLAPGSFRRGPGTAGDY